MILIGTWGLLREVARPRARRGAATRSIRRRSQTYLAGQPGVADVHDLHIWAMSTTETALTVHLVRPGAPCDDAFLARLRHELHDRFAIEHATIQVETGEPCPQAPAHVV